MNAVLTRRLLALHRWCGLFVSLNLLVLTLTGMVLMFRTEIDSALTVSGTTEQTQPTITLQRAVALALEKQPGSRALYISRDAKSKPSLVYVGVTKHNNQVNDADTIAVDTVKAQAIDSTTDSQSLTGFAYRLHTELLLGAFGHWWVALSGLALLASVVSGAMVYVPMLKRHPLGLIRTQGAWRAVLSDIHKLLGTSLFAWTVVVASTGVMLSLSPVVLQYFSTHEIQAINEALPLRLPLTDFDSLDAAIGAAENDSGKERWAFVAFPGSDIATTGHYSVFLQNTSTLGSSAMHLSLVNAHAPHEVCRHRLPWYLQALLYSEPLHFGNYGGSWLKYLWVLFAASTLALVGSGLFLFVRAALRRTPKPTTSPIPHV